MDGPRRYARYANLITTLHALWTFLLWGGMAVALFIHAYAPFELGVLTITLLSNLPFRGACPLTLLEEKYRRTVNPSYTNGKSFMTTYINKLFKTDFSAKGINIAIAVLYVISYFLLITIIVHSMNR